MQAFNLALLAKQGWRTISNPTSLVAQVLKAKYFPNSTFWKASRHTNSSVIWKSIWDALGVLELGTGWQIGNGCSISVWNDQWIPRPVTFKPISPCLNVDHESFMVSDLLTPAGSWNIDLVNFIFYLWILR